MRTFLVLLSLVIALPALSAELKIATWNIAWLTTRSAGLPANVVVRSEDDLDRLAHYAKELNADVVAIQEVDGVSVASKVFPPDKYSIHMTGDHVTQRVGIVIRLGLRYDINPDLTALGANQLRSGADVTLHLGAADLRILVVHLKRGCRDMPLKKFKGRDCELLREQIPPIADWIAARRQEAIPFLVLGDFNRWMTKTDSFLAELSKAAPLARATEGRSSPCWGAENFIDHILAGGRAAEWMRPETLRVLIYQEKDPSLKDRLSDHCPVSVRFVLPE